MFRDRAQDASHHAASCGKRAWLLLLLGVATVLALAACGGGSSDSQESQSDSSSGDSSSAVIQAEDLGEPAQEPDTPSGAEGEQAAAATEDGDGAVIEPAEEVDPEDAFLLFAECLRDEGLDVSDPGFSSGRGPGGILRGIDRQDPEVQAALETCRPLIESARPELTDEEQAERQDAVLAFTKCLRSEGLDVSDPDFSGGGRGGIFRGSNIDPQDPEVQAAIETCRDEVPDFGGRRGGGGGRG